MRLSMARPLSILVRLLIYAYLLAQLGMALFYIVISALFRWPVPATAWTIFLDILPFLVTTTTVTVLCTLHHAFSGGPVAKVSLRLAAAVNASLSTWAIVEFARNAPNEFLESPVLVLILLANPLILCLTAIPALHRAVFGRTGNGTAAHDKPQPS